MAAPKKTRANSRQEKPRLAIVYRPLAELTPYANNARTHSAEQVAQIAASMREFGFTNPVLVDERGWIIAGHGRVLAAAGLEMTEAPTITLAGLSEAQRRAYVIADNKLAINASWDADMLKVELEALHALEFDMGLLGFNADELAAAMALTDEAVSSPPTPGIDYVEKFAVLVDCTGELHQQEVFEKLQSMGYSVKVLVN